MRRHLSRWGAAGLLAVLVSAFVPSAPSQGEPTPVSASASASASASPAASAAGAPRDGRIAVANVNSGQIETLNPDGSAVQQVSPPGDNSIQPAWAPDGSRIAYASQHADGDFRLYTVRSDGTGRQRVIDEPDGFSDFTPAYRPGGARLVFTRCRPDPPGGCALFSVRTGGRDRQRLTADVSDRADLFPDVSPDGRRIAFTRFGYRGIIAQVWIMRSDGSRAHPITTPRLEAGSPQWTRDGRHLLVTSLFSHVGENIYRIRDDGTRPTKLTSARFPHNAQFATPSPSGAHIVFSDDRAFPQVIGADLFLMDPNGGGQHPITSGGRLLDADWGTAPLVEPGSVHSPYARARSMAVPHVGVLPRGVVPQPHSLHPSPKYGPRWR